MSEEYQYLFSPLKIGPVTVKNRLMLTAHDTTYGDPNDSYGEPGFYGERYAHYLAERAKGGVGLIIYGQVAVHPSTAYELHNVSIAYDEGCIPGFKTATDKIHQYGAKVFVQLFHSGAQNNGRASKLPVFAPSAIRGSHGEIPKAMEIEDIQEVIKYYGISARNAKAGGFDGVEIHSTHGYLPHSFLSPLMNHRDDEYGGSLENRMRFLMEVVDAIRQEIGPDMALGIRLCGDDMTDGGLTMEESAEVAAALEDTGKVDYISVTTGNLSTCGPLMVPVMYTPSGYNAFASANIREAVNHTPVFVTGRIADPHIAENLLAEGQADMIGMARAFLADPEFANKAAEGRSEEIRLCVGCGQGCIAPMGAGWSVHCIQNPECGKEEKLGIGTMQPAEKRKRVMVVGGGRGGMEAARVAALRGHEVVIYEKTDHLGGQFNLAVKLPGRAELQSVTSWAEREVERLGIEVVYNTHVTAEVVQQESPDAVIVATGSEPIYNGMYTMNPWGIEGASSETVLSVEDVLEGASQNDHVVVFDTEGFIKGPGIVEYLALQGKKVTYVLPGETFGALLDKNTRSHFVNALHADSNIELWPFACVSKVSQSGVTIEHSITEEAVDLENVDVVFVCGNKANDDLYFQLKGSIDELYRIGDCVAPRTVDLAIFDGYKVGRAV